MVNHLRWHFSRDSEMYCYYNYSQKREDDEHRELKSFKFMVLRRTILKLYRLRAYNMKLATENTVEGTRATIQNKLSFSYHVLKAFRN